MGIENNSIPNVPSVSIEPSSMPNPNKNQNKRFLDLANNEDENNNIKRRRARLFSRDPNIPSNCLIFDRSVSQNDKYHKINYTNQLAKDLCHIGCKKEYSSKFSQACDKLRDDTKFLNFYDFGILKKGFADYNHSLSTEARELLHSLAQDQPLDKNKPYCGLKNLTQYRGVISENADIIKNQIEQDI